MSTEARKDAIKGEAIRAIESLLNDAVTSRATGRHLIEIEINMSQGAIGPANMTMSKKKSV